MKTIDELRLDVYDLKVMVGRQAGLMHEIKKYLEDIKAAHAKNKSHVIEDRLRRIDELLAEII